MRRKLVLGLLSAGIVIGLMADASAEAADEYWGSLQKQYYPNKTIEESNAISIAAPGRAESGAQVPFTFTIDHPMTQAHYIKSVSVIADANPVPLVAVYHLSPESGKVAISTRIRLEVDSYVHVVAEASDGRLIMSKVAIRAAGGCGGTIGGDESVVRQTAGKMKLVVKPEFAGSLQRAYLLIKHPMYTGLQRDLESQGFRPAFFINKIVATFNDRVVFDADTFIGVSEDPNIQFPFMADKPGTLKVVIKDNEGKEFTASTDVVMN